MIHPDDIRRKAGKLYPRFLQAWLDGETFFPRPIPANLRVPDDPVAAIDSVRRLRDAARETRGFGYDIEWKTINSRRHGRNRFPQRILFPTRDDFLQYVGLQREFSAFRDAVNRLRARYPELDPWIRTHRSELITAVADIDGLLKVVDYLREHPRPGLFARELPLSVDTKFVERNRTILSQWLDIVLPPHAIRADEQHFERRYGLRYAEPHLMIRFLDEELQRECGSPWPECSLPLHTLAGLTLHAPRVLIVENKVNLLTLPMLPRTLALGGLGNSVTELRLLPWLHAADIRYWGDIDVDGLAILSRLRVLFPQTGSVMMDGETVERWRATLAETVEPRPMEPPAGLTGPELSAFRFCVGARQNRRIEQERLPQEFAEEVLRGER